MHTHLFLASDSGLYSPLVEITPASLHANFGDLWWYCTILLWFSGPLHSEKNDCAIRLTVVFSEGPRSSKECVGDVDEAKFMEKLYQKKGKA